MSILTGASAIFPLELRSMDSQDSWETTIITLKSGAEQRNICWSDSLRVFDASTAEHLTLVTLDSIRKHFNAMRGSGFSFPLLDRSFFQVTDEGLGAAGGIASTMQLSRNDGVAANAYNKEIYLPKSGTVVIKANTVSQIENTDYTLAYTGATGGTLTWLSNRSGQTITWTGEHFLPARYDLKSFPGMELFIWTTSGGLVRGAPIPMREVRYLSEV